MCFTPLPPLYLAVKNQDMRRMTSLLEEGASPNPTDEFSPLHLAIEKGAVIFVKTLLQYKADPNQVDERKMTPLSTAITSPFSTLPIKESLVDLLLNNNANPNQKDKGAAPLILAATKGYQKIIENLLKHQANPNQSRADGQSPLLLAIQHTANPAVVKVLLEGGADCNQSHPNGETPLSQTIESVKFFFGPTKGKVEEITKLLLEHRADPNQPYKKIERRFFSKYTSQNQEEKENESSLLHLAIQTEKTISVKLLLEHKADPNLKDSLKGRSPLHKAVLKGQASMVEHLLEYQADPNAKDQEAHTPLFYALHPSFSWISPYGGSKNPECLKIVETLLKEKAELNTPFFSSLKNYDREDPDAQKLYQIAYKLHKEIIATPISNSTPTLFSSVALIIAEYTLP